MSGNSPKGLGMSPTADVLHTASAFVTEAVNARRSRGMKLAVAEVARFLGFSERRVRAFLHHEVRQLLATEWLVIQAKQRAELEDRLRRMDAEAAIIRTRLAECSPA